MTYDFSLQLLYILSTIASSAAYSRTNSLGNKIYSMDLLKARSKGQVFKSVRKTVKLWIVVTKKHLIDFSVSRVFSSYWQECPYLFCSRKSRLICLLTLVKKVDISIISQQIWKYAEYVYVKLGKWMFT